MNIKFLIILFIISGYFLTAWYISKNDPTAYKETEAFIRSVKKKFKRGR